MEEKKEPLTEKPLKSKNYILDILIIIILSLTTVIAVFALPDGNILRIILGIIFILFCPGYALVSLLWPKTKDMNNLERIALSFGLSIVIVIIVGLILNYTPWKLALSPILFTLFGFVIIASILSLYRRARLPENERFFLKFDLGLPKGELSKSDKIVSVLIVASLIVTGAVLAYVVVMPKQGERYTEFYILDKNGTTEDYPKNLTVGENGRIIIGIVNHEGGEMNYTITVNLFNETDVRNDTWEYSLDLNDSELHEFDFDFDVASNGTYTLEFLLFREIDSEPYFEIHLNGIVVRD